MIKVIKMEKTSLLLKILILNCLIIALATIVVFRGSTASEETVADTGNAGNSFLIPAEEKPFGSDECYPDYTGMLVISELMPKNKATMVKGCFEDWVEILNLSDHAIPLDNWRLTCDGTADLTGNVIRSGEYLLVLSPERFSIKDGSRIALYDPEGRRIAEADIPEMKNDVSLALSDDGKYVAELYPTPGFENSKKGYCDYQETLFPEGDLIISEVVVYNISTSLKAGSPPTHVDWVEIKNISGKIINMSDYYLSDKVSEPEKYCFPDRILKPGEYLTVLCSESGNTTSSTVGMVIAPFALNSENEKLILSKNGTVEDCVPLKDIPFGCSFGRMDGEAGFFYFEKPSCGKANTDGCRYVSDSPSANIPGGQYMAEESLIVELSGPGTIYYTLDSSEPTNSSTVYTGPIEISRTTVLRAFSCEEEQLGDL